MWYIEKECQYCSWIPFTMLVEWTRWSEDVTSNNIWCQSTTHIMLPVFLRNIQIVHNRFFTSKASSSEIARQKYVKNINMKRDITLQMSHLYKNANEMQVSGGLQSLKHKPFWKKKCFRRETVPHKSKHQHNTTKSQKLKRVVCTWRDNWPPRERLHMKDLLPARVTI